MAWNEFYCPIIQAKRVYVDNWLTINFSIHMETSRNVRRGCSWIAGLGEETFLLGLLGNHLTKYSSLLKHVAYLLRPQVLYVLVYFKLFNIVNSLTFFWPFKSFTIVFL
ncbi:hypothetical protein BDA99DRAFT_537741 [Phascolomyces articulosus]|uniref:Uncharacterized protein n=1 Tax=Phascolomyces articulosus TaxID=60185 RepID=A0AAD5KA10_9FUNG|nr:hypothetical protein BDA99DRAFT_537741 [Phascolomyces articulosus]